MSDSKKRSFLKWPLVVIVLLLFLVGHLALNRKEAIRRRNLISRLTSRAREYTRTGNYQDALYCCERIFDWEPENTKALHIKAFVYQEQGDYKESLEYYQKALDINQNNGIEDPCLYIDLADLYIAQEYYQKAVIYWQKAQKILEATETKTPDEQEGLMIVYSNLAFYNLDLGHEEEALGYFTQCLDCIDRLFAFWGPVESSEDCLRDMEISTIQLLVLHNQELLYNKLGREEDAAKISKKIDDFSASKLQQVEQ